MEIIDHKKVFKNIYTASNRKPIIIDIPKLNYLMIDGKGAPEENDFQNAAKTIFTIAYILKFEFYNRGEINYKVMPLELKWYLDRINKKFRWTMMIMQPDFISRDTYLGALETAKAKQKDGSFEYLRFETLDEGKCVQMLHKGPYNQMNDTLRLMKGYAKEQNLICENDTHDIYLNDSRKTKPENLKTIMRIKVLR